MAKVKITIKGIAMSYHKDDGIWKVIFPFNADAGGDCHNVRFTVDGAATAPLAAPGRTVSITAHNPKSKFAVGKGYKEFLDLTADYSHDDGVLNWDDWKTRSVFLSMENAVFSLDEMTKSRYALELDGRTTKKSDYLGYSGIAEIEAERVDIKISDMETISITTDAKVIFDNTCEEKTLRDNLDFQMVYFAVKDKKNPKKEFNLVREPADMPKKNSAGGGSVIVFDNPPEGVPGLPCNKVRISNPKDLP